MSSTLLKSLMLLAVLALSNNPDSCADYLVNTLNSPEVAPKSGYSPIYDGGSIAEQFTTTPTSQYSTYEFISGLAMKLYNPSSLQTGTVTFDLYSNSPGAQQKNDLPDQLISTIGSVSTSVIGTNSTTVSLTGFEISVSMNTRYWIVATLSNAGSSSISYYVNNDVAAFNPGGTVMTYGYTYAWNYDPRDTAQPLNMAIFVTNPVPEPSTYAMACLGVMTIGYIGRRRRKSKLLKV